MADHDYPVLYRRTVPDTAAALGADFGQARAALARPAGYRAASGTAASALIDALDPSAKIVFSGENDGWFRRGSGATMYPLPFHYRPNIVRKSVPVPGTTVIKVQEAGAAEHTLGPLMCNFERSATALYNRLYDWIVPDGVRQTSAAYPYGRFGLWYPVMPRRNRDPHLAGGITLSDFADVPQPIPRSIDVTLEITVGGVPLQ